MGRLRAGELDEIVFDAVTFQAQYPNSNFLRFRDADLPAFAASFAGQPFLRDHGTGQIENRDGTISGSELAGQAFRQRVRLTTERGMRSFLEGQIDRFSIGWYFDGVTCSVCNHDWFDWRACTHFPGRRYKVKDEEGHESEVLCELIFENPRGKETSAVNAPAVTGTHILSELSASKAQQMEGSNVAENEKVVAGEGQDAPQEDQGSPPAADPVAGHSDVWSAYLRQQATEAALSASGLGESAGDAVRGFLAALGDYEPVDVDEAIAVQKAVEAAAAERSTVQNMTPITEGQLTTGADAYKGAVDWLFGLDVAMPEPGLRRLDQVYQHLTGDVNWYGAFDPEFAKLANANTATFTGMAADALNKVVQMHYDNQATYRWFENIVEVLPHDGSTHDVNMVMVDGVAVLPVVNEGAAYTEANVGDSNESMSFSKRGHYVGITLEMIRKSDIVRIRAVPQALVQASVRTRSGRIANLFTQNSGVGPTLADDSLALFHSTHGNLSTVAFSSAEWAAARQRIWEQSLPGTSLPLGLWPRFCLLPIDLYDSALTAFGYGQGDVGKPTSAGTAQEPNPYGQSRVGDPRPIPIPVPEFTDTNDWGQITDPREHAPIKMAYANQPGGSTHPAPEIFQVQSETAGLMFTNDVMPIKIRDWFSFGVATYVGVGKNNVA